MKDDSGVVRTAKKRRKIDEKQPRQATTGISLDPKHEAFTQWSRDRGVKINNVKPAALPGRGIGLMTTAKIRQGEQILFVPEKAMFKPNVTSIGKTNFEIVKKGSPQAQLALCLAAELSNESSSLQKWRTTWPTPMDFITALPINWPKRLRDLLPASVHLPLDRQNEDWTKDIATYDSLGEDFAVGESDFHYCWEIVNSRSFHFKPAGSKPGYMVLCPFIDYMNHGPNGTTVIVRQTPKGYEVVADRDYESGKEILATYGAHSNDKLLVHYGFINSSAPGEPTDDDIRLDHIILPAMPPATREALQDVGFLGGYTLLPATNDICFRTQVAIRAMLLTANEWEYFIGCGEDLSGNQSEKVLEWMRPKLKEYRSTARKMLDLVSNEGKSAKESEQEAIHMLKLRWQQVIDAIETFQPSLSTGNP